jgi:hypothetical protein
MDAIYCQLVMDTALLNSYTKIYHFANKGPYMNALEK